MKSKCLNFISFYTKKRFSEKCDLKDQLNSICVDSTNKTDQDYFKLLNTNNSKSERQNLTKRRLIETVSHNENLAGEPDEEAHTLSSKLRRAFHCSFVYKNFYYIIGGYSFLPNAISFISRLDLDSLKWEHSLEKNYSKKFNRSNRRQYSDVSFEPSEQVQEVPEPRYAHTVVLDEEKVCPQILKFYS